MAPCTNEKVHEMLVTTGQANSPAFPARWFTTYSALSPAIGLFCHRPRATRSVVASSRQRRGAKTTRFRRPQHDGFVSCITRVHRIPRPTLVTIGQAPLFIGHGTRKEVPVICPSSQAKCLRHVGTPGKSPCARETLSSDKQLLGVSSRGCGARRRGPSPRKWQA